MALAEPETARGGPGKDGLVSPALPPELQGAESGQSMSPQAPSAGIDASLNSGVITLFITPQVPIPPLPDREVCASTCMYICTCAHAPPPAALRVKINQRLRALLSRAAGTAVPVLRAIDQPTLSSRRRMQQALHPRRRQGRAWSRVSEAGMPPLVLAPSFFHTLIKQSDTRCLKLNVHQQANSQQMWNVCLIHKNPGKEIARSSHKTVRSELWQPGPGGCCGHGNLYKGP